MTMIMTEQEARALARAIELMRPTWQAAGIAHAIGQARLKANKWTVAIAALTAAAEDENRTPAVIPLDGRHWPLMPTSGPTERYQPPPPLSDDERAAAHDAYLTAIERLRNVHGPRNPDH